MALYMDRHELANATPEELAQAHLCDLEVQDKYGVRFVTYWYHQRTGSGFCLVEAPTIGAAEAAHREAHGNLACDIIEVEWSAVEGVLGRIREPTPGEVWEETPLRAIVCTELDHRDVSSHAGTMAVRNALKARGALELERDEGVLGCFPSIAAALEYGLAMQESFAPLASFYNPVPVRTRVGIGVGEPVSRGFGLFGQVSDVAVGLCAIARPGETLVSGDVYDLFEGSAFVFEERSEVILERIETPVRCYRLRGRGTRPEAYLGLAGGQAPDGLSPRELEVLRLIAHGRTNQEIAGQLFISLSTVTTHVRSIFEKAQLSNRAEAAAYAFRHRLVPIKGAL